MMPNTSFTNLTIVAGIAFLAPLLLGFAPRLRLPATVLEILAGIVLGPSVLGWVAVDTPIQILALIGVTFILFLAGLEIDFEQLRGQPLLRDAALIWLVNILTFSLWYWEIDGGGPGRRHHQGYHNPDFGFPQAASGSSARTPWLPHYIDYLFLAFNTSTAFSPTDTLVLSVRAKLLMMTQALISLTVLAIIAARAINTL